MTFWENVSAFLAKLFTVLTDVNNVINNFVWVEVGLVILVGTGVLMTILTGCFQ